MKYYVDVCSGRGPLNQISNDEYDFRRTHPHVAKDEELHRVINIFYQCYEEGAVPSIIRRRINDSATILTNIVKAYAELETTLSDYQVFKIYEAALKGITDSCSSLNQEHFQPAESK